MSLRDTVIDKAFGGYRNPLARIVSVAGVPSAGSAPNTAVGVIVWDATNSDAYITTVASTTWVKINA